MLLLLSVPVTRWLCVCSPLDLCGWQYLARVLVEGLKETAPSALSGVSRLVARRRPVIAARVSFLLIERSIALSNSAVPVSRLPLPPVPLSSYNRTCPDTLPTKGRVFSWSSRSLCPRRSPLSSDPKTS